MAAAALQPAAALNLGGVSATVRTNPENADTKLIGNVILIEVASIMGAGQHPASALIQAEASGRCSHSLAPSHRAPYLPRSTALVLNLRKRGHQPGGRQPLTPRAVCDEANPVRGGAGAGL